MIPYADNYFIRKIHYSNFGLGTYNVEDVNFMKDNNSMYIPLSLKYITDMQLS